MTTIRLGARRLHPAELLALLALSVSLAALGIDIMLPAFGAIRAELGLPADSPAVAGLVTSYLLGLALGSLLWGPLADRFGRRPVLFAGYGLYAAAALAAAVSPTLPLLLASRAVWGVAAASPRVVTFAVARDVHDGEELARAMSFIMAVFLLVPIVAPTIGAAVATAAGWRWVFGVCVLAAAAMALWARRLPETLDPAHRIPLRVSDLLASARVVLTTPGTVAHLTALTVLFGAFVSYIATSELLVGDVYGRPEAFPAVFGGLAATMGLAMLLNARLVRRVGARRLTRRAMLGYLGAAGTLLASALVTSGRPPALLSLIVLALVICCHAWLLPNLTSITMGPMAAVAGTASALIGAIQTAGGSLLGSMLDRAFDGTITPLAGGFLGFGIIAAVAIRRAEHAQRRSGDERPTTRDERPGTAGSEAA